MLFDPARHEPLAAPAWNDGDAEAAIRRIVDATLDGFEGPGLGWPMHPLDDPQPGKRLHFLYIGAAGVLWALHDLAADGAADPALLWRQGFDGLVAQLLPLSRAGAEDFGAGHAAYLVGDAGVLLLQWRHRPDPAVADALFTTVEGNLTNPAREPLWGNPGTLLAAVHMAGWTGDARWPALVRRAVAQLCSELEPDPETGTPVWEQDLYGRRVRYLGAGHGLAGNVYAVLRAAAFVPAALVEQAVDAAWQTLSALALHAVDEDGSALANWHPMSDAQRVATRVPLVQDCHGAPGIVCRLADGVPRTEGWDRLLAAAGELTWRAGPLTKGASICHGTAGSALACLKLFLRFGDERWLERARALALHGAAQVERHRAQYGMGRHSLWTGDLGLACVLQQCRSGGARFPTLDATPGPPRAA